MDVIPGGASALPWYDRADPVVNPNPRPGGESALPWYDRGFNIVIAENRVSLGGVVTADHWSYVVGANKIARVANADLTAILEVALGLGVTLTHTMYYKPQGGGEIVLHQQSRRNPAIGTLWSKNILSDIWLNAGDTIRAEYSINGAGGTVQLHAGIISNEYTP